MGSGVQAGSRPLMAATGVWHGPIGERIAPVAAATSVALAAGLLSSLVMPRGPVTALHGIVAISLGLAVGVVGGALRPTRWMLIPVLVGLALGVEAGRLGTLAPSLAVRFDTPYGIIAFALTRGVHALLLVPAVVLGVLIGIVIARRIGHARDASRQRRPVGTSLLAIGVAGLALLVAWPASTPPVLDPDGQPIPGSIAELTTVRLGGADQSIMIRAADPADPVILYLAGGPGQSDLALTRAVSGGWEQDFVWVGLDQRGNGKSYPAIDPVSSMTVEQAVADVVELSEYLRQRFDERRIYLMGESWGTILGVLAVQQRPDLYYAWIPSGQMVDVRETDRRIYEDLVTYAEHAGDQALLAQLDAVGTPPYRDIPWANSNLLAWYEYLYRPYTPSPGYLERGAAAGLDPFGVLGSEYDAIDKSNVLRGLIDTFALVYPQLYAIDLRAQASRLEVPVYLLDGSAELAGRRDLALEWFAGLEAPIKERVELPNAAHAPVFEQADDVQRFMNEVVVPATYRVTD
jgi:pimeloyl-ACP methyl ester carboxylesterase